MYSETAPQQLASFALKLASSRLTFAWVLNTKSKSNEPQIQPIEHRMAFCPLNKKMSRQKLTALIISLNVR